MGKRTRAKRGGWRKRRTETARQMAVGTKRPNGQGQKNGGSKRLRDNWAEGHREGGIK